MTLSLEGTRVYHRRRRQFGTIVARSRCQYAAVVRLDESGTCTVASFATLWPEATSDRVKFIDSGIRWDVSADDFDESERIA
jgi:hypothetical protein